MTVVKLPPVNIPVTNPDGTLTPAWLQFFQQQLIQQVNATAAAVTAAPTTQSSTVAQALLG